MNPTANKVEDLKHLEFLALNSKEVIEKQVDSYRQQHSYAGTIIGATALFISFFLNSLDSTHSWLQLITIVPTAIFISSIPFSLSIFRTKLLDQAFSVVKYNDLPTKKYKDTLLYEIKANSNSYILNRKKTGKGNKMYDISIRPTTVAPILSIVLILVNKFIIIEQEPAKVQVVENTKNS